MHGHNANIASIIPVKSDHSCFFCQVSDKLHTEPSSVFIFFLPYREQKQKAEIIKAVTPTLSLLSIRKIR